MPRYFSVLNRDDPHILFLKREFISYSLSGKGDRLEKKESLHIPGHFHTSDHDHDLLWGGGLETVGTDNTPIP